tara:strand:+ start:487 stop:804 length:318 start_codon:yes stop_codon:yes gene_type:complete
LGEQSMNDEMQLKSDLCLEKAQESLAQAQHEGHRAFISCIIYESVVVGFEVLYWNNTPILTPEGEKDDEIGWDNYSQIYYIQDTEIPVEKSLKEQWIEHMNWRYT